MSSARYNLLDPRFDPPLMEAIGEVDRRMLRLASYVLDSPESMPSIMRHLMDSFESPRLRAGDEGYMGEFLARQWHAVSATSNLLWAMWEGPSRSGYEDDSGIMLDAILNGTSRSSIKFTKAVGMDPHVSYRDLARLSMMCRMRCSSKAKTTEDGRLAYLVLPEMFAYAATWQWIEHGYLDSGLPVGDYRYLRSRTGEIDSLDLLEIAFLSVRQRLYNPLNTISLHLFLDDPEDRRNSLEHPTWGKLYDKARERQMYVFQCVESILSYIRWCMAFRKEILGKDDVEQQHLLRHHTDPHSNESIIGHNHIPTSIVQEVIRREPVRMAS